MLRKFEDYTINFSATQEPFSVDLNLNSLQEITDILVEVNYLDPSVMRNLIDHFDQYLREFSKRVVQNLQSYLVFKQPSTEILQGYHNLSMFLVQNYKILVFIQFQEKHFTDLVLGVKKQEDNFL